MAVFARLLLGVYLFMGAFWDIKNKELPTLFLLTGFLTVPFFIIADGAEPVERLIGLIPGVVLLAVAMLSHGIGIADVIIVFIVGISIRIAGVIAVLTISFMLMAVVSGVMLVIGKLGRKSTLPYIPFAFIGYILFCVLNI